MKNATMNKEKEISLLQQLKGDTYFALYFESEEIDMMCDNIRNDHPIELGVPSLCKSQLTSMEIINSDLKKNIERLKTINSCIEDEKSHAIEVLDRKIESIELKNRALKETILDAIYKTEMVELDDLIEPEEIISYKIRKDIKLTDEEKKAVMAAIRK